MSVGSVSVLLFCNFYVLVHLSKWFTFSRLSSSLSAVSLSFTLAPNGWGCGKCGRACYVFVPRRKRPSGRNRSEVPVSTHIGYTPCYRLVFCIPVMKTIGIIKPSCHCYCTLFNLCYLWMSFY